MKNYLWMEPWELVRKEQRGEFEIRFSITPDKDDPAEFFAWETKDEDRDIVENIRVGKLLWFSARVTASKAGVVLGSEYLGGCCYENTDDFLSSSNYESMAEFAIDEARETLVKLCGCKKEGKS